jgi:hypothetical protein
MFSPRQHLRMSQRLRRKASVSRNPGPLLRASAKFLSLSEGRHREGAAPAAGPEHDPAREQQRAQPGSA